jgi:hypothetical protein
MRLHHFNQQWLDEMHQVIDLLELAAAVLIQLSITGKNMQRLQKLAGLLGFYFATHTT